MVEGRVSRIDTSIINGTVTVDVALRGALPPGARPDLSVDGKIELDEVWTTWYMSGARYSVSRIAPCSFLSTTRMENSPVKVKVTFGRASVNTIEIKSGLNVGDQVILSDMSAYDNYDRIKIE